MTLGIQPSDADFTPGNFTLRVTNNTGNIINTIYVAYDILVLNNADRANSFNFSYSTDDLTYTPRGDLDYASPAAASGTPTWVPVPRNTTPAITGLTLADGAFFYLRWSSNDAGGSSSRDEFGLDNVEVGVNSPTAVTLTSFSFDQPATSTNVVILVALLTAMAASLFILGKRKRHGRN